MERVAYGDNHRLRRIDVGELLRPPTASSLEEWTKLHARRNQRPRRDDARRCEFFFCLPIAFHLKDFCRGSYKSFSFRFQSLIALLHKARQEIRQVQH